MRISANLAVMAAVIGSLAASPVSAATPGNAGISFVNHRGIEAWDAANDRTLYIQSEGGNWYVAKTIGQCVGLSSARRVGFDTGPVDTLDRSSSIVVHGHECPIASVTRVHGPPGTQMMPG